MEERSKEIIRIGKQAFSQTDKHNAVCQELATLLYPERADFTQELNMADFAGYNMKSTAVRARYQLASSIAPMLRQSHDWFRLTSGDEELDDSDDVALALDYAAARQRDLVNNRMSGFKRATIRADHDWVTFGNAVLSVEESPNRDHQMFKSHHPKDNAWMTDYTGRINKNHRRFKMEARAVMNRPGWAVNKKVMEREKKNPADMVDIWHVLCPMEELYGDDPGKRRQFRNMPFLSIYLDPDSGHIYSEGGSPVFNYVIPRWDMWNGINRGFSPIANMAYLDARTLQSIANVLLEQSEKALDPALITRGDIFRNGANTYAGGITNADLEGDEDLREAIMALDVGRNIGVGFEQEASYEEALFSSFLLNKLNLPHRGNMREAEVYALLEEYRRAVLPFFQPIEDEYHTELLDVSFQLGLHAGFIDPDRFPDQLRGRPLNYAFDSPITVAEGRAAVTSFREAVELLGISVQFDKKIIASMDLPQMTRDAIKGTGAKADWFKSDEEQLAEEERARLMEGIVQAAQMVQGGANVVQDVSEAAMSAQSAGMLPAPANAA